MPNREQRNLLKSPGANRRRAGAAPPFGEMDAPVAGPKAAVHASATAPEESGSPARPPNHTRAIDTGKPPGNSEGKHVSGPPTARGRRGKFRRGASTTGRAAASGAPVKGPSPADLPVATARRFHPAAVSASAMSGEDRHRTPAVKSDSPTGAGINDGNVVVVREQSAAESGDIVATPVDGGEAAPNIPRRRGAATVLAAANPAYETRFLPADRGKVSGGPAGPIHITDGFSTAASLGALPRSRGGNSDRETNRTRSS